MYSDDDMLMLSGIQHYRFCPRQWALTAIEQQWEDNRLTIEGQILHQHVDDPFYRAKQGDVISLRSVAVASHQLGLYGITDMVELHRAQTDDEDTITHPRYPGRWKPVPIEYKRGRPKIGQEDEVQLVAQTICLEEMYGINISHAAFFYGQTRHRTEINISQELRQTTQECADAMHQIIKKGHLPVANYKKRCESCSLVNICLPKAPAGKTAAIYLQENLYK